MILFSSKVTDISFHVLVPIKASNDEYHEKTLPQTFTIPLCFPVQQLRLLPKQTRDRVSPHQVLQIFLFPLCHTRTGLNWPTLNELIIAQRSTKSVVKWGNDLSMQLRFNKNPVHRSNKRFNGKIGYGRRRLFELDFSDRIKHIQFQFFSFIHHWLNQSAACFIS